MYLYVLLPPSPFISPILPKDHLHGQNNPRAGRRPRHRVGRVSLPPLHSHILSQERRSLECHPVQLARHHLLLQLSPLSIPSKSRPPTLPRWQVDEVLRILSLPRSADRSPSINIFCWAVVLCCHAACTSFGALFAVRFLLGICEGAITPGFLIVTAMFYTRAEQTRRVGYWCQSSAPCCPTVSHTLLVQSL